MIQNVRRFQNPGDYESHHKTAMTIGRDHPQSMKIDMPYICDSSFSCEGTKNTKESQIKPLFVLN